MTKQPFAPLISLLVALVAACGGDTTPAGTYAVAGAIYDDTGAGIADVRLEWGEAGATASDAGGGWVATGLVGEVTIVPRKDGFTFQPASYTVSAAETGIYFTAIKADTYAVSGWVLDDSKDGLSGVTLRYGADSVESGADGSWAIEGLSGEVTVTPEKAGLTFSPASYVVDGAESEIEFVASAENATGYSVSGRVRDESGFGVADVLIGYGADNVTSDAQGKWSIEGLAGEVTLTPGLEGMVFAPASRVVNRSETDIDFVASPKVDVTGYMVSGTVSDSSNSALPNVVITFNGEAGATTDANGKWSKDGLEDSVTIAAELDGWTFSPASYEATEAQTGIDFVGKRDGTPISGAVLDGDGKGVYGIAIQLGNGLKSVTTSKGGEWKARITTPSIKITPSHEDFEFSPPSQTVTAGTTDADFQAHRIHRVGIGQPYKNIPSAIEAALPEDIVEVYPGTYRGGLISRKPITLRGSDPSDRRAVDVTIVDGPGEAGIKISTNMPGESVVEGLTFRGFGFGVVLYGSTSTKSRVRIANNVFPYVGTGLEIANAHVDVEGNRFHSNERPLNFNGGDLLGTLRFASNEVVECEKPSLLASGTFEVTNNVFENGKQGHLRFVAAAKTSLELEENEFHESSELSVEIQLEGGTANVSKNLFSKNGGALRLTGTEHDVVGIRKNRFEFNQSQLNGGGLFVGRDLGEIIVEGNVFERNAVWEDDLRGGGIYVGQGSAIVNADGERIEEVDQDGRDLGGNEYSDNEPVDLYYER